MTRQPAIGWRSLALAVTAVAVLLAAVAVAGVGAADRPIETERDATETLVVDADGGAAYESIQAAVNAADHGDTVEIRPGTYRERVTVGKSVRLVAPAGATLNGSSLDGAGITVRGSAGPEIRGLTVLGYWDGIRAVDSSGDAVVGRVTVRGAAENGLNATGAQGDWTVRSVRVEEVGDTGIDAEETSGDWALTNVTVRDAGRYGVDAGNADGRWTVENATVRDARWDGINARYADGRWTVANTTVRNVGSDGVSAGGIDRTWTFRDVTFRNVDTGIDGDDARVDVAVDGAVFRTVDVGVDVGYRGHWAMEDVVVRNATRAAVTASGTVESQADVTLQNATIWDVEYEAIQLWGARGEWTLRDSRIRNLSSVALDAVDASADLTVANVTIAQVGGAGIDARSASGNWTLRRTVVADTGGVEDPWTADEGINATGSTGDWVLRKTVIRDGAKTGLEAIDAGGDWTILDSVVRNNTDTGVVARNASGEWAIHRTVFVHNALGDLGAVSGIDATGAVRVVDATRNWWGTASGPDADDCAGAVDCSAHLTSRPESAGVDPDPHESGVPWRVYDAVAGEDGELSRDDVIGMVRTYVRDGSIDGIGLNRPDVLALVRYYVRE